MIFFFISIANLWIWHIFSTHILLGSFVIITSLFLYKSLQNKKFLLPFFTSFLILSFFQIGTTSISPLSEVSKQEELAQINRLKEYPPVYLSISGKTLWIPAAHWLESRPETIVGRHILKNSFQIFNLNLYFFANHPRERVGFKEFEKFPYLLLPFFLYGTYSLCKKHYKLSGLYLVFSILFFGVIGNNNPLGPFLLFPFIATSIGLGMTEALLLLEKSHYANYIKTVGVFVFGLVLIQVISYAIR